MIEKAFISLFIFCALDYFLFLSLVLYGIRKIQQRKTLKSPSPLSVSIVIPFRNERSNLLNNLSGLLEQNYPKDLYEIIFVDDFSTDDSASLISEHLNNDKVKILMLSAIGNKGGKKEALTQGINIASGEIIVTSDADCIYQKDWIKTIATEFDESTGFISSPVILSPQTSFFEKLQSLEFAGLILTGAGLIGIGKPTICNGANAAFRKNLFLSLGGYSDKNNLASGDDELVMKKIFQSGISKVKFLFNSSAAVSTSPLKTVKKLFRQRIRWASKGQYYDPILLITFLIPVFLFFVFLILAPVYSFFTNGSFAEIILTAWAIKMFLEYIILLNGNKLFGQTINILVFLVAELFHPFYIAFSSLAGLFFSYSWKERKV